MTDRFRHNPPSKLQDLVAITENGKRFYTLPDGSKLPSVTTVLKVIPNDSIDKWKARVGEAEANRVSALATGRGNGLHKICEEYLNNYTGYKRGVMPDALEMFFSLKPLLHRINNIHHQECCLFSKLIGAAGRADCIAEFDGKLSIIDFKTSKRLKSKEDIESYFIQETFYSLMYQEMTGQKAYQLVTIMAVDHEKPLLFIENTLTWVPKVVEIMRLYNANINDSVPLLR